MAADFELPRWMMDAYNGEIDEVTLRAGAELVDFLSDYDLDEMDLAAREALRDETIAKVNSIIDDYGDATASIAADFHEELSDMAGEAGKAIMPPGFDTQRTDRAVRRAADSLFGDGADIGAFANSVSTYLARAVSHRADECVAESAVAANEASAKSGQKGKKKFARIPSGPSCGFCIMLASRGFVYATRKSAGELTRFHNDCDCRIVEGHVGMVVEGYDPEGMYKRYKSCRDAIRADANPSPIRRDWDALPAEEKARYYVPGDPKHRPSYDQYLQHRIAAEMDTRDRQWLYDGTIPMVDTAAIDVSRLNEVQREAFDRERGAAEVLAEHGFRVRLIDDPNARARRGIPRFDYELGDDGEMWEAKCPTGRGYLAVTGNIAKADNKFRRVGSESMVVLSNLDSDMSDEQFRNFFIESLNDSESDYSNVSQILFVYKDRTVERWTG